MKKQYLWWGETFEMLLKHTAHSPLDSISLHGTVRNLCRDHTRNPGHVATRDGAVEKGKERTMKALEVPCVYKIRPCEAILLWHLYGEAGATLTHTAAQNTATIFRLEASAKTVRGGTFLLFRLVRSLHNGRCEVLETRSRIITSRQPLLHNKKYFPVWPRGIQLSTTCAHLMNNFLFFSENAKMRRPVYSLLCMHARFFSSNLQLPSSSLPNSNF